MVYNGELCYFVSTIIIYLSPNIKKKLTSAKYKKARKLINRAPAFVVLSLLRLYKWNTRKDARRYNDVNEISLETREKKIVSNGLAARDGLMHARIHAHAYVCFINFEFEIYRSSIASTTRAVEYFKVFIVLPWSSS